MNTIAMKIAECSDILRLTNDLLEARANHRQAQNNGSAIGKVIDLQVKVLKAELALAEMYPPEPEPPIPDVEPLPDCGETKAEHADHYRRHEIMTADERADDPRRGQTK